MDLYADYTPEELATISKNLPEGFSLELLLTWPHKVINVSGEQCWISIQVNKLVSMVISNQYYDYSNDTFCRTYYGSNTWSKWQLKKGSNNVCDTLDDYFADGFANATKEEKELFLIEFGTELWEAFPDNILKNMRDNFTKVLKGESKYV